MTYQLSIQQNPTYLHVVVTGTNSRENIHQYLEEVRQECLSRKCFRALIEERLQGPRLGMLDVFEIASSGAYRGRGTMQAVAYVDMHEEGTLMKFAANLASHLALPVQHFQDVDSAREWLLSKVEPRK